MVLQSSRAQLAHVCLCLYRAHVSQITPVWGQGGAFSLFHCCRLDEALSQYLGNGVEVAPHEAFYPALPEPIKKCPQCGKDMVLKAKKNGG